MQLLIIIYPENQEIVDVVNTVGLPLVLSNSIGIAIFTAMIGIIVREQENEAAEATKQALTIAEEALPFLKRDKPSEMAEGIAQDRKSTRLNSSHVAISYAVFCLKKKKKTNKDTNAQVVIITT